MPLDAAGAEARITIVVLAGGDATRLPGKLSLPVDGEPMLARVLRVMSATGAPCLVAAGARSPEALGTNFEIPVVYDDRPGEGPLAALASAARAVHTPFFLAVAGGAVQARTLGRGGTRCTRARSAQRLRRARRLARRLLRHGAGR